jgi:hypothetical protein
MIVSRLICQPNVCVFIYSTAYVMGILLAGFLLGLHFNPEDGGDKFLRNMG